MTVCSGNRGKAQVFVEHLVAFCGIAQGDFFILICFSLFSASGPGKKYGSLMRSMHDTLYLISVFVFDSFGVT